MTGQEMDAFAIVIEEDIASLMQQLAIEYDAPPGAEQTAYIEQLENELEMRYHQLLRLMAQRANAGR